MDQHATIAAIRPPPLRDLDPFVRSCLRPIGYDVTAQTKPGITYFGGVKLGIVDVVRYEGVGMRRVSRAFRHIQADHMDDVLFCMPLHARVSISHYGMTVGLEPGSFIMYQGTRPVECNVSSTHPQDKFSCIHMRVSASSLRRRLPHLEDCCDHPIALRPGAGQIMKSMIDLALAEAGALSESQSYQFGSMVVDSIANVAGEAPEIVQSTAPRRQPAQTRIFELASRYIESHLSNPALDAELVAQHCHVSSRYLREAFAGLSANSVAAFIREMRLQQCQASLRAPRLQDRTVTQIAIAWGFNDPAHFSRLYKKRFDKAPSQDRHLPQSCEETLKS